MLRILPCLCIGSALFVAGLQAAEETPEARFRRFDADNDGIITQTELPNAEAFQRFDLNRDGKITLAEVTQPRPPQATPTPTAAATKPTAVAAMQQEELQPLGEPFREQDPVLLIGKAIPTLLGRAPDTIVAFRYDDGWQQIPVQIDERFVTDLGRIRGGSAQLVLETPVYADPAMRTGADPDATLDDDDELVFMYRDAGSRADAKDPAGVVADMRVELQISDELTKQERFAYLFVSAGELKPAAGKDYVNYTFKLLKGQTSGIGPNDEDSLVRTARYQNHFAERWTHDGTRITVGKASGVNILDRDEFEFRPGVCNRTTDTFNSGGGACIAQRDGPVRAIRSVMGCNSGTYSQRDHYFYEGRMTVRMYYRVHAIGNTWSFYDFTPAAQGMTYYDNQNLSGVRVDGVPDDVKTDGPLHWQFLTGDQGSLTMAWIMRTDIPKIHRYAHYFDQTGPEWIPCTGDKFAFAASGPATGELPNTDPVLRTRVSVNSLETDRIVFYDEPNLSVAQAQARVTAAWFPVRTKVIAGK